jgi:hypothetical protein
MGAPMGTLLTNYTNFSPMLPVFYFTATAVVFSFVIKPILNHLRKVFAFFLQCPDCRLVHHLALELKGN